MVVKDLTIFRLSKISGKINRDSTQKEYEKCRKDCIVFKEQLVIIKCYIMFCKVKVEFKKILLKLLKTIYTY